MKLIGNIEVSGIERIVFKTTGDAWFRSEPDEDGEGILWFVEDDMTGDRVRNHEIMMKIVRRCIWDPVNYRIWIHGETMNIESMHDIEE